MLSEGRCAEYAARRLAEFARRCRKRGLAVTPQRLATIRGLLGAAEHPRAVQFTFGCTSGIRTSRSATVHRTLETLCEIGEARKVTMLHDRALRWQPPAGPTRGLYPVPADSRPRDSRDGPPAGRSFGTRRIQAAGILAENPGVVRSLQFEGSAKQTARD